VVSRLIKVENTITYIPGGPYVAPFPYYNTFYGYYGAVYPVVYSPDYLREEKKVRIETNLYVISSEEGELVWTGVTDTFNPSNVHKAINGLVKLVVKQMQSEGVLPPRNPVKSRFNSSRDYFMSSRTLTSSWSAVARRIKPARGYSASRMTYTMMTVMAVKPKM